MAKRSFSPYGEMDTAGAEEEKGNRTPVEKRVRIVREDGPNGRRVRVIDERD